MQELSCALCSFVLALVPPVCGVSLLISLLELSQVRNISIQPPGPLPAADTPGNSWWWSGWHLHVCLLAKPLIYPEEKGEFFKAASHAAAYNFLSYLKFSFLSTIFHQKGFNGKFHKLDWDGSLSLLYSPNIWTLSWRKKNDPVCQTWKICPNILKQSEGIAVYLCRNKAWSLNFHLGLLTFPKRESLNEL